LILFVLPKITSASTFVTVVSNRGNNRSLNSLIHDLAASWWLDRNRTFDCGKESARAFRCFWRWNSTPFSFQRWTEKWRQNERCWCPEKVLSWRKV